MKNDMKELITTTTNPAAVGRLLRHAADRFEQIVAERRRASAEPRKANGGADGGA